METPQPTRELGFFIGKYGPAAMELFKDLVKRFDMTPEQADAVCLSWITDYSRYIRDASTTPSVGKVTKSGTTSLKDLVKAKGVPATPALRISRLVVQINELWVLGGHLEKGEWMWHESMLQFINPPVQAVA